MEKSKKTDFSEKPIDEMTRNDGTNAPGCPFWFFGDENSADNDLKKKFEVVDEKED